MRKVDEIEDKGEGKKKGKEEYSSGGREGFSHPSLSERRAPRRHNTHIRPLCTSPSSSVTSTS
ncbi:hypothetical protein EYF80_009970 [Liparis tanakae]|uniref:Uncharacterized protein n=1 Tax=Liparis tanakae TaxID=230148 RepID=A0A4Z2IRW3_9TELE|nr:hypothetical protein EYF80_009970 [Liparis tanakae]